MPLMLTTDCPSQEVDGVYAFYDYQFVTLTAMLDQAGADIPEGTLVYFAGVAAVGQQLQPIGNDWVPAPSPYEGYAVGVPLSRVAGADEWHAQLVVRVAGRIPGSGVTYAYIGDELYVSSKLHYTINPVSCVCPSYVDGFGLTYAEDNQSSDFWLDFNYAEQDQSPDNPGNNYLYYRFQVTDPETYVGLRNICVRVSSSLETIDVIKRQQIILYDHYSGSPALNAAPSCDDDYVDLRTDDNGIAELYLCPKARTSSVGVLTYKIGANEGGLGPYLIVDPYVQWSTLDAPQTDNPVPLVGSPVDFSHIPQYAEIEQGQWLFLLCNGRFQSSKKLKSGDIGTTADIMLPFQKSVLRSKTAPFDDATQNSLIYVAYSPVIRVSSNWDFDAVGTPPAAAPDDGGNRTLDPPLIRESPEGWPINAALLSKELHVRVPLDSPQIARGDEIRIHIYLNGYRRGSDEPLGISIGGPFNLYVTQFDIENGFIEWPFLPRPFWGLGAAQSSGDVGTIRVNYDVARGTRLEIKRIVSSSQDLLLGIDTILPNGYTAEVF